MEKAEIKTNWSEEETVNFYTKLFEDALKEIPEGGAVMVLGPMFILRTIEENFALFEEAQAKLKGQGMTVFNQLPFTDHNLKEAPFKYDMKFDLFYKKLIESGKITKCYLLPDWDKSKGTKSEIQYCKDNNIPVVEL